DGQAPPDQSFKVPSGMASGLKIKIAPDVVIAAGQTTSILLDFDLGSSFHVTGSGGEPTCADLLLGDRQVIFHPVVHATPAQALGVISGTVFESDGTTPAANAEVTAFAAVLSPPATRTGADLPAASTFSSATTTAQVSIGGYALVLPPG